MENETRAADFLFENNEVEGVPHLRISDNGKGCEHMKEGFGIRHVKPEYEDAAALARANNLPLAVVLEEVNKGL